MTRFEVVLAETRLINVEVEADNEEDAGLIAEEQYYAEHSIDDTLADFYIKEITQIPDSPWGV